MAIGDIEVPTAPAPGGVGEVVDTPLGNYRRKPDGTFEIVYKDESGNWQPGFQTKAPEAADCKPPYVWDPKSNSCMLPEDIAARDQREQKDRPQEQTRRLEESENSFKSLATFLNSIGLGSLFSYINGQPSGWLWSQIQQGVSTRDELLFALEQTPEFQDRFSVIFEMRNAKAPYVPNVSEVLEYEKSFARLMTGAGVPSWFFDSTKDAQKAMSTGLAITQIEDRLQRGYQTMQRMPQQIKDAFSQYYGQAGDAAMLAAVLDPQKTLDEIDRSIRISQIGGYGKRAGFDIGFAAASEFGQVPMSEGEIQRGIETAAGLRALTVETMGEGQDLTEQTALAAGLGGSAMDQQLLENRLRQRQTQQASVAGGASVVGQGVIGAGVV